MKTSTLLFAGLFAVTSAQTVPLHADAIQATHVLTATSNATTNATAGMGLLDNYCYQPANAVPLWYRLTKNDGPHGCHVPPLDYYWAMLRSYRDGGVQNVHWKYTDNPNDLECMENWIYHAADGQTVKAKVPGRTTTFGLNRRWCGLPVYNDGGVQGFQWDYCRCSED